jgi:NTP pyrophosphatase (non-canonical NTP hydrolase)
MSRIVYIREEAYITLATIAECYECSEAWLREIYDVGLLGTGEIRDELTLVRAESMDRVAWILRLSTVHGLELDVILHLLD